MGRHKAPGVTEVEKGVYRVRIQRMDPRTGRLVDIRRVIRCASLREVLAMRDRLMEEVQQGKTETRQVRIAEYAESWMTGKAPTLKPSTRRTYADALDRHILPTLGDFYVNAIAPSDIRAWFAAKAKSYAPATANGHLRVLKTMMADACEELDIRSPAHRIKAIPEHHRVKRPQRKSLTKSEMRLFLDALRDRQPRWYPFVFVQFAMAARFGEVSALRWEDIDEERGIIRVRRSNWRTKIGTTKTNREKVVPLAPKVKEVLRGWRQTLLREQHPHLHGGWVFPARTGKPHHGPSCLRKPFEDALKHSKIARRFSSHGIRHTANDLLRRVASGQVTRSITGHVTEQMTERYSFVDLDEQVAAVTTVLELVEQDDG